MTTIDDLPNEILAQIFQSVALQERKKNRRNFLSVSRRWKTVVEDSMGLEIFIGASPWSGWEDAAGGDHVDVSKIQQVGVVICHVGELIELEGRTGGFLDVLRSIWGKVRNLFSTPSFPQFKYPHLLQSFRFSGIIRNEYFHWLVTPTSIQHLHQLQLNHSSLSMLESSSLHGLSFQCLEFLEIMADFTYIFRNIDDSKILTNLLTLLRNQFPSLKTANMYIPYNSSRELEITKSYFSFLLNTSPTLRCMEMFYFYMLADESEDDLFNNLSSFSDITDPELTQITQQASRSLQLQIVMLHINIQRLRCFHYWVQLLKHQHHLEYLVVLSEHQLFSQSLIRQTSATLRIILASIDIRGPNGRASPLDCDMFKDCGQLTHFSVKGNFENFVLLSSLPGILHVESVPQSVNHIDISRIPVRSDDLRWMMLSLENLAHFTAKFVGKHGEMGVTMELLREVVRVRKLQWIHLVGSVNGSFPPEGLSNGHPSRPIALYMDEDSFCVKLNRTGYYGYASAFEELQASLRSRATNR